MNIFHIFEVFFLLFKFIIFRCTISKIIVNEYFFFNLFINEIKLSGLISVSSKMNNLLGIVFFYFLNILITLLILILYLVTISLKRKYQIFNINFFRIKSNCLNFFKKTFNLFSENVNGFSLTTKSKSTDLHLILYFFKYFFKFITIYLTYRIFIKVICRNNPLYII